MSTLEKGTKHSKLEYDKTYKIHYGSISFSLKFERITSKNGDHDRIYFNNIWIRKRYNEKFWQYIRSLQYSEEPVQALDQAVNSLRTYNQGLSIEQMDVLTKGFEIETITKIFEHSLEDKKLLEKTESISVRFNIDYDSQDKQWYMTTDYPEKTDRQKTTWKDIKEIWKDGRNIKRTWSKTTPAKFYKKLHTAKLCTKPTDIHQLLHARIETNKVVKETAKKLLDETLADYKGRVEQKEVGNERGFRIKGESGTDYWIKPKDKSIQVYLYTGGYEKGRYLCIHHKDQKGLTVEDKMVSMLMLLLNDKTAKESAYTLPDF
jgi:hypothetical protein